MRTFSKQQLGLNLIEVIIFILILSIALGAIISVYIYTTRYSADTTITLKTVELSQALMDEVLSKKYDEKTPAGGACVGISSPATNCNSTLGFTAFGVDAGESRNRFDDIDDYHDTAYCGANVTTNNTSCSGACNTLVDETGTDISADYAGFSVCIKVSYAGTEINNFSLLDTTTNTPATIPSNDAKRIDLIIIDPLNSRLTFTAYKTNF